MKTRQRRCNEDWIAALTICETNRAGIDLYNATWYKLLNLSSYDKRLIESTTGEVEWSFAQ